jgi:hypothetical protein
VGGLHEYEPQGEHQKLIKLLSSLMDHVNLKSVIFSRLWPIFTNTFGAVDTQLNLADVNRRDIANYVCEQLAGPLRASSLPI